MEKVQNYSLLAPLYDKLMEDVDYESWADYIDEIIQEHHPQTEDVLELACGTGSLSLSLDEFGYYKILGTDLSPEMIEMAEKKASELDTNVKFQTLDFTNIELDQTFDTIFSVFDSVNYLHSESEILKMLSQCRNILNNDGLLIFDFSTPINSYQAVDYLNNDEAQVGQYRYFRSSEYNPDTQFHTNTFKIEELNNEKDQVIRQSVEVHKQKIYSLDEMLSILKQTPYHLVAKYEDFDLLDATENSARVTIVLRCQKPQ